MKILYKLKVSVCVLKASVGFSLFIFAPAHSIDNKENSTGFIKTCREEEDNKLGLKETIIPVYSTDRAPPL